jgi:rSAM/selenodomain-associated transferase 1
VDLCLPLDSSGVALHYKNFMKKLLIFARYPEAGHVKSRLARAIGEAKAASAYKTMVEIVVKNTKPCNGEYERILCYDPPSFREKFQSWLPIRHLEPQSGCNLGEKMKQAFSQALAETEQAVLIGTDCIDVNRSLILKAFQELEKADLVLGPAKDGGYYLIGCSRVYPELFSGIDWSTERVFSQTLRGAEQRNLRVSCLPPLTDIDTAEQYNGKEVLHGYPHSSG